MKIEYMDGEIREIHGTVNTATRMVEINKPYNIDVIGLIPFENIRKIIYSEP